MFELNLLQTQEKEDDMPRLVHDHSGHPRVIQIRINLPIDLRRKLKALVAKMEVEQGERVTKDDALIKIMTEWFEANKG